MTDQQIPEGPWVLIAEDDIYIDKAYGAKFAHENIAVVIATDGDEALKALRSAKVLPKVMLLDLMMPKKNGFEVLTEIKADAKLKNIPVLVLSNLGQEADAKRGVTLGAAEYLVKADMRIDDIVTKVKKYLEAENK